MVDHEKISQSELKRMTSKIAELGQRIAALEKDSHLPVDFGEMFKRINARIDAMEKATDK